MKFIRGRQTEKFKKHKKEEDYDNISFSIVYLLNAGSSNKNKFETTTIDLTCKDSKEFEIWFYGLKACTYAVKNNYDLATLESLFLAGIIYTHFDGTLIKLIKHRGIQSNKRSNYIKFEISK